MLATAGSAAAQPSLTAFQQEALKAIYAVLPYERERFALSVSPDPAPVALYSDARSDVPTFEQLHCASNAGFTILSRGNEAGAMAVSVCPEHLARLRTLAAASAQGFDAMLALLQKGMPPIPADKRRAVGWYRERSTLPGGGEFHYVALIAVGHGVVILPTVVLLTDRQAVVVQTESMQLCGLDVDDVKPSPYPLCADPKGTLNTIAQRLLR